MLELPNPKTKTKVQLTSESPPFIPRCQYCNAKKPIDEFIDFLIQSSEYVTSSSDARERLATLSEDACAWKFEYKERNLWLIIPSNPTGWQQFRVSYKLNASSIKAVIKYDFFKSEEQLCIEKSCSISNALRGIHKYVTNGEPLPDASQSIHDQRSKSLVHITRGVLNEPLAKATFELNSGHCLIPLDNKALFCRNTIFNGNLSTTPDGITYCGLLFEAKCPQIISKSKVKYYEDQVQAMLNTIGLKQGILFQYDVATGKYHSDVIERDDEWASKATQKINNHMDHIDFMSHVLSHPLYYSPKNKSFRFQDVEGNLFQANHHIKNETNNDDTIDQTCSGIDKENKISQKI